MLSLPYIPLLSSTLPPPPAPVGYATVRAPARAWSLPSPIFRAPSPRAGEPALRISRSTWALYYPTTEAGGSVQWIPEPVTGVLRGYDRYFGAGAGWLLPLIRGAAARYHVPVAPNAPLKPAHTPYPLVIFSHGICGTRTTYSQWAAALASEGYAVLAVEHADGSAPCVLLPDGEMGYTVMKELEWGTPTSSSPSLGSGTPSSSSSASLSSSSTKLGRRSQRATEAEFRALQLDQRVREVYAAHAALEAMLSPAGDGDADAGVAVDGLSAPEAAAWISSLAGHIDTARPALAGHSFGASTVFRALEAPPPDYARMDVCAALALDHWWEPFPFVRPARGPAPSPPLLAINSQEYTQARQWPHVLRTCVDARADLVTILGTNHESFCDFPVIVTASPATERAYLATIHRLTLALLRGTLAEEKEMQGEPDGGAWARTWLGRMAGRRGEVVVHLRAGEGRGRTKDAREAGLAKSGLENGRVENGQAQASPAH
ncbi:hypothetical protein CC85DRAFT_327331 [Cutaneotrichosporon oleaginosum]|uniref:1-alkyl-2-acetylglycerophosphocholine esterase n=1 Tax=Cutaneotrichosporon oleaginosum TaxID=879819 RepID=A0A0J0XQI1_9TREE|nr:uncharacterized protein CC85DRAFT_327331 [Cutaneotrichosporon oleaginosum]KLT43386.1 hypothetical protein CC85DRAFT_327331 [Cutaneotrichosporon oleaginosum]TXT05400.1 hypothetical protein COLE_06720 [Cutaneotrichosporon oleaginosum]